MNSADWPIEVDQFGCWNWTGKIDDQGYPLEWRGRTPVKAYLITWTSEHGQVPAGLVLDHRCRNRKCVRPWHLQPVTQSVNLHRRSWRVRVLATKCISGQHELKDTAVITPTGGRLCRVCDL